MAMKDESEIALQTPSQSLDHQTSIKSNHETTPGLSNGVEVTVPEQQQLYTDLTRVKKSSNEMKPGEGGGGGGEEEEESSEVRTEMGEQLVKREGGGSESGKSDGDGGAAERPTTRSDNRVVPVACCMKCDTEHSDVWHKTNQGIVLCSACSQDNVNTKGYKNKIHCKRINNMHNKKITPKGAKKNKESKLKKSSHKLPYKEATYITSNQICYKGVRYKVGDVFSIRGKDRLYYICIRSFMEDPLCNQYAVVTWLLPLYPNPVSYNPNDFLLGPAEDVPRPLDCLSFVSHDAPQGHVTLNELRCYDNMPDLWERVSGGKERSGLELLLEAMEPDIHQIR